MIDPSLVTAVTALVVGIPVALLVLFLILALRYRRPGLGIIIVGAVLLAFLGTLQSGIYVLHYLWSQEQPE